MSSLHYDSADRPSSTPINAEHVYLEGDWIVVPDGYVFPQICLVTGETVSTPPIAHRYARTRYVSEADMTPGSLNGLLAGQQRNHFGPKSTVSFCLNDRLMVRRRMLAAVAIVCLVLAFPVPIAIAAWAHSFWPLVLFPVFMGVAGFCLWRRDSIIHTRKVTPSYLWIVGVNKAVREAIYAAGCKPRA